MRPHISLNVKNVPNSISFYEKVFKQTPQKQTSTYAKFDLKNPALNFSIQSGDKDLSRVNHFGIEVDSAEEVNTWNWHLSNVGVIARPEKEVSCCFALQDKVWFQDPDGNEWEIFYVKEQLPVTEKAAPAKKAACGPGSSCC